METVLTVATTDYGADNDNDADIDGVFFYLLQDTKQLQYSQPTLTV